MIYSTRPDWFIAHVRPRAVRRAIVAFVVAAIVLAATLVRESKLGVAVSVAAFLCGVFDLFQLKRTRSIVESLKISVSEQGLCFIFGAKQTEVIYPWHNLVVTRIRRDENGVRSFVVADRERKQSHVEVVGYEDINGLFTEVEKRVGHA